MYARGSSSDLREDLSSQLFSLRSALARTRFNYYVSLTRSRTTPWYLLMLGLIPVVAAFTNRIWRDSEIFGTSPNELATFALLTLAVALWFPYKNPVDSYRSLRLFLGLWIFAWALAALTGFRGTQEWVTALPEILIIPTAALLIAWKPPSAHGALWVAKTISVTLATFVFIIWLLERWGEIWYWQQPPDVVAQETAQYWLFLNPYLDVEGRWFGLLDHPNDTALWTAAGTLIAVGTRAWKSAAVLGIATLLTGSRTSLLALLLGLAVLAAYQAPLKRLGKIQRRSLVVVGAGLLVLAFSSVLILNPSLTGRTSAWSTYWALGLESPYFGVGDSGLSEALASGQLQPWAGHAHNLVLDIFVRFGSITLLVVISAVVIGLVLVFRGVQSNAGLALAITVLLSTVSVTERIYDPRWFSFTIAAFWLAVLMSRQSPDRSDEPLTERATVPHLAASSARLK